MAVRVLWDTITRFIALLVLGLWIYVDQVLHSGNVARVGSELRSFLPIVFALAIAFSLRVAHRPSRSVTWDYRVGSTLAVGCLVALFALPAAVVLELFRLDSGGFGTVLARILWHLAAMYLVITTFGLTRRW
jgi:hypothetical protein